MSIPKTKLSGQIKGTIYYPKHGKTSMLCLNDQELQKLTRFTNKIRLVNEVKTLDFLAGSMKNLKT